MNTKLYVENLAPGFTGNDLMDLFSTHGNVVEVNLPLDRINGRSRGSGFVTMATPEGAQAAIQALHGKEIGTRTITVREAWPRAGQGGMARGGRSPSRRPSYLF